MCGQAVLVHSVSYPNSAAFLHVDTVGKDSREDSMEPPRFSVDSLYDASISAREEDEILTELASFLPCQEDNGRTSGSQSHHVFFHRKAVENALFLDPPCLPSEDLVESSAGSLKSHSGYPMESWNYDMCNIDSTSSSPGKELTFANLSKDKSIPPTPIKEWTSRKRELLKIAPEGPSVWTCEDGDLVILPASPTKEWASPTVRPKVVNSSSKSIARDESPLPLEWFSDLDRSELPQSCWDATDMMSTFPVPSVRKGEGIYLSSLHPCTEALDTSCKLQLSSSDLVVGTHELECMESPPHQTKVWILASEGGALHNTPVSVENECPLHNTPVSTEDSEGGLHNSPVSIKKIAYTLPKSADSIKWKSTEGVDSFDVSTPANTDVVTNSFPRDSPPTPAMEEELLDELAKLFRGSPDLDSEASSEISRSSADSLTGSLRERPVKRSAKLSKSKYRSKFIEPILGRESFLSKSAKKLEFILEDGGDGHERNLGIEEPNCLESWNVMAKESQLECYGALSPRSAATLQAAEKMFDRLKVVEANGNTGGPRFPRKIQNDVCYDGFNLEKHVNRIMPDHISDGYTTNSPECLRGSPWGVSDESCGEVLKHTPFVEGDYCDKAVDGNIVTSPASMHQAKDVLIDRLCPSSTDWQTKPDEEKLNPPSKIGVVSLSFDRHTDHAVSWPDSNSSVRGEKGYNFAERQSDIARTNIGTQQSSMHKQDLIHEPISYSEDRLDAAAEAPSDLADGRDMAISYRNGCTGHSPHRKQLESTLSDTSSALLSKQERSSSMSVSRKYFLQSPSMRLQRRGCDSDSESVTSTANVHPAIVEDWFENLGQRGPTEYGRASFAYEELSTSRLDEDGNFETMLKHRDMRRLWAPENLSGPLLLTCGSEANSSFRRAQPTTWDAGFVQATGPVTPSLQDLCKLWDEEYVDLLTRSLKYKSLMTDPNLLSHEVSQAYDKPGSTSPQAIAFEIQNIERLLEKLEDRESHKELVKQQRDNIYINIATNATMRERYRLYSNWGIRRMSRGRLRKVIYELLWKDPKRYHASADLVLQYL